jgi:1-aminocyclopropane-1-carboxylate deaminase
MLDLSFDPPVQPFYNPLFESKQLQVFIKREDLIHPFVSGNKWRKLKYVLKDARENGATQLVSFGGAYSNHLVALACAGAMYGFAASAFVRGEKVKNPMLTLCETWGMNLQFVSRDAYKNKQQLFDNYYADHKDAYFIDEGGKGELAMKGSAEILDYINDSFTHVVCPVGTGTTLAGLAIAAAKHNMMAEGICVLKGSEELTHDVKQLVSSFHNWKIHYGFHRGGYAKTDDDLMVFIKQTASTTGILFDQVYTAKMMLAVIELVKQDYYKPGSKLLLIHTGGLLGLLSQ